MKSSRATAGLIVVAIGLTLAATLTYMLSRGFSALDEPSRAEAFIAQRLRHMALPRSASEMSNPVPASSEALLQAMEHFADHCAFCHANDGSGNTPIGKGLYPKPPDMRQSGTQNLRDGELFYIIQNGVRFTGMPAFGTPDAAHDEDSWELVLFIRHLPQITDEELVRMKEMNPKTPADFREEEEIERFLEGNDDAPSNNNHKHH
jgi:mono/diheme cytochrome c family protein